VKAAVRYCSSNPAEVRVPASKSLSHRALICAALAKGNSHVHNLAVNEDILASVNALKQAGIEIKISERECVVESGGSLGDYDSQIIDCGQSGSTLRFLIPLLASTGKICRFTGQGRLMERPLMIYRQLFEDDGIFEIKNGILTVQGQLNRQFYTVPGNISSQFVSGLLFALPLQDHDSRIEIIPPIESLSYIDMTIESLSKAGIRVERKDNFIIIPGHQKYQPFDDVIAGDDSQAAFFIAQALIQKREMLIRGVDSHSTQGDHAMVDIVRKAGARVRETAEGLYVNADKLEGLEADLGDCPDLGPMLFALAACCSKISHFTNVARLRLKESDRIAAMREELTKTGCRFEEAENDVWITGNELLPGGYQFQGHNDHRIVMALAILASGCRSASIIDGSEAVGKSYPGFFEDLRNTQTEVSVYD
jgi:3-phosphoshikimate 1-carboxyvinyltransferase